MVATGDVMTRSDEAIRDPPNSHCTFTVTSLSTASGSVTVQFRVCLVPSYRGSLGTARATDGVGTGREGGEGGEGGREGREGGEGGRGGREGRENKCMGVGKK